MLKNIEFIIKFLLELSEIKRFNLSLISLYDERVIHYFEFI